MEEKQGKSSMGLSTILTKRNTITVSLFAVLCLYGFSQFVSDLKDNHKVAETHAQSFGGLRKRKSKDCEFSTQFNLSRAVITPALLQTLSARDLAGVYGTRQGILEPIVDISRKLQPHSLPKPMPSATCVIMGSSGALLDFPHLGDIIDNYDYVIRLNFAPTKGFEEFVGSKTTMYWSYLSASLKAVNTGRRVNNSHIVYGGCHAREFRQLNSYLEKREEHPMFEDMLEMLNDNKISFFSDYTRRWLQKVIFKNTKIRPTTGLQAMLVIAHWCPTTPDFAGFGLSNKTAKYHYFDAATLSRLHFARDEIDAINKLRKCHLLGEDLTHTIQAPIM